MVTIHPSIFEDKLVIVMGLGLSGLATAQRLHDAGVNVVAWDDDPVQRQLASEKNLVIKDPSQLNKDTQVYGLILSPGIPHHLPEPHPIALYAQQQQWPIICDVDIFLRLKPKAKIIGVSGTNGKSTTTALIAHILQQTLGHKKVIAGGNIGAPIMTLPDLPEDGFYVIELSSYQLERMTIKGLDGAVLLNITPDHLARHGDLTGYQLAKQRLFEFLKPDGWGVIGFDDASCQQVYQALKQEGLTNHLITLTTQEKSGQVFVDQNLLWDRAVAQPIINLAQYYLLPGLHNWQNAAAAYAMTKAMGCDLNNITAGLKTFSGLEHRQECLKRHHQVVFVNDSKATNVEAAIKALNCYPRIYWIAGGQPKEPDFTRLAPHLSSIVQAFFMGEAAPDLVRDLGERVPSYKLCDTLDQAVTSAIKEALQDREPSVVLLSPACASFDQFKNFEERGQAFKAIVQEQLKVK